MSDKYDKCIKQWNEIFSKDNLKFPLKKELGNAIFDNSLKFVAENSNTILDFGCGNGTMLFLSSLYGTKKHIGIDLSEQAISNAKFISSQNDKGEFLFQCGGIDLLKDMESKSADGVILSNIIDNLYPEDALLVLDEVKRILTPNGKAFIKLNPYLSEKQIKDWNIKIIKGNFLDDGMFLWNNTTEQWTEILSRKFNIFNYSDIYYKEYDQYNRIFLLTQK